MDIDDSSFKFIADVVYEESGIVLPEFKRNLIVSRLLRRLSELEISDFATYCRYIDLSNSCAEREILISLMTTNVTKFFREEHHFERLKTHIWPSLIRDAKNGGKIRIWSAGCASGEEAYSLAISLLEEFPGAVNCDVKILATDIDTKILQTAEKGRFRATYGAQLDEQIFNRYFVPNPEESKGFSIGSAPRQLVKFQRLNLIQDWVLPQKFDVIFCKNVAIYFDAVTQEKLWKSLSESLKIGGHLFIGQSERADRNDLLHLGQTIYQRIVPKTNKVSAERGER